MYKDVKKKLLSVALCICMVIGAVQVVPRAKAAATASDGYYPITVGEVGVSGSAQTFYVKLKGKTEYTYTNKSITPEISEVITDLSSRANVTNKFQTSLRVIPGDSDAKNAGTFYGLLVGDGTTYSVADAEDNRIAFTIKPATITRIKATANNDVILKYAVGGVQPELSSVSLELSDGNTITYTGSDIENYCSVGTINEVGSDLKSEIKVKQNGNFTNWNEKTAEVKVDVAYDLGSSDFVSLESNSLQYTGTDLRSQVELSVYNKNKQEVQKNLNKDNAGTLNFVFKKDGSVVNEVVQAGTYTVEVTPNSGESGKAVISDVPYTGKFIGEFTVGLKTGTWNVQARDNDSHEMVTLTGNSSYLYTISLTETNGVNEVIPKELLVELDNNRLDESQYDLTFTDTKGNDVRPTKAGQYTMRITPKPSTNYGGYVEVQYYVYSELTIETIQFKNVAGNNPTTLAYSGSGYEVQNIVVKDVSGNTLNKNTHFTIEYEYKSGNNWISTSGYNDKNMISVGSKRIVIKGKNAYKSESVTWEYSIGKVAMQDSAEAKNFELELDGKKFDYTGSAIKPGYTFKYRNTEIDKSYYDEKWSNNTNAGGATLTVTAKNSSPFTGSLSVNFTINALSLQDAECVGDGVSPTDSEYSYTGKPITPTLAIRKYTLKSNDYTIEKYENAAGEDLGTTAPTKPGSYKLFITQKNSNITGSTTIDYSIIERNISSDVGASFYLSGGTPVEWQGGVTKPEVICGSLDMTEGTDYEVSYADNTQPTTIASASAIITGKGYFTGTKTLYFDISKRKISNANVKITPKVTGTVPPYNVTFTARDEGVSVDKKDLDDKDYKVTKIVYETADDYTPGITDLDQLKRAGKYVVTVEGQGNYEGTTTVDVLCGTDISTGTIIAGKEELTYNGTVQYPTITVKFDKKSVRVKKGDTSSPFTLVFSRDVSQDVPDGKEGVYAGEVTVQAVGNPENGYYGTTTGSATYTIKPMNIENQKTRYKINFRNDEDAASFESNGRPHYIFTNKPIVPKEEVVKADTNTATDAPDPLVKGVDYTIEYGDECISQGTHWISVTGIGNFTGSLGATFVIDAMGIDSKDITAIFTTGSTYADGVPKMTLMLNGNVKLKDAVLYDEEADYQVNVTRECSSGVNWEDTYVYTITGLGNFAGTTRIEKQTVAQTTLNKPDDPQNPQAKDTYVSSWDYDNFIVSPTSKPSLDSIKDAFTLSYRRKDGSDYTLIKENDKDYTVKSFGALSKPGPGSSMTIKGAGGFNGEVTYDVTLYTDIKTAEFLKDSEGNEASVICSGGTITVDDLSKAIQNNTLSELITFKNIWPEEGASIPSNCYTVTVPGGYTPKIGKVTLTISGNHDKYYTGTRTIDVNVTGALNEEITTVEIGDNNTIPWKGETIMPGTTNSASTARVLVKDGTTQLYGGYQADVSKPVPSNWDYVVTFDNNTGVGLATATITGVNKYSGTITKTFKITYDMARLVIKLSSGGNWVEYDSGSPEYPYQIDTEKNKPAVKLYYKRSDDTLSELSTDLYSLTYSGYEYAGNAMIGIGEPTNEKYQGILLGSNRVVNYVLTQIDQVNISIGERTPIYTGYEMTADDIKLKLTYGSYTLTEADYSLNFKNAINVGTAMVVIALKGNFSGTFTETFDIQPMLLSSQTDIDARAADLIYTGTAATPSLTVTQQTGRKRVLEEGKDYKITYYLDETKTVLQENPFSQVGNYYVRIEGLGNYVSQSGQSVRDISYAIKTRELTDGVSVAFVGTVDCPVVNGMPACVYNGKEHRPGIQVTYNKNVLNGPSDNNPEYSVEYANNTDAGKATVTVTGVGSFAGTRTIEFTIQPKDISGDDIKFLNDTGNAFQDGLEYDWTKSPVHPAISVYDTTRVTPLSEGAEYKLTYTDDNDDQSTQTNAGLVTMTITGQNNYTGTQEFTYYIGEDISKAYTLVNGSRSVTTTYNGLEQAPAENSITVEKGSSALTLVDENGENRYDIAYYKNGFDKANKVDRDQIIDAATYYIAVVGVPSKGTYAKTSESNSCAYTIYPRSIAPSYVLVSGYDGSYYYTGQPIEPKAITVEDTDLPVTSDQADLQRRSVKLVNGTDYDISYTNNTSAGKASIIVTGKGNYGGSRVAYFNIVSSNTDGNNTWNGTSEGTGSISNGSTTISAKDIILGYDSTTYNCMMYNGYERIPTVSINGLSNSDFVITASNNIRPGVATLMITGINNYTGTIYKNYTIKADLSTYGTVSTIVDQSYTGYQITPYVTVTCGGNLLTVGNDYTVTYANNTNVGRATVIATAAANSYYVGTANGYFNISNTATGMEITGYASSYTYTGNAITPDVIVTMNGRMLNRGTDYTVTYSNNTNVGTATMTVTGIGSFSGTKTINYVIEAKNIENCITTAVNNYQYTGNTYTPSVTLTDSSTGKTLAAGTDYTITYSNNTNPGTASITVTALSRNYTGSKVISFKITSAAVSGLRVSRIKNNSMKLSWSDQDYADGYQICNANNRVIGTTSNNSYTVKRLTSCTTYRYKVRSYVENADGSVSYGNFSTAVAAQTMLNTPTLKARSTTRGNVTLTWSKVAKASGYEIYYSTEKNGIYTKLKTVSKSSARRYVDSGLASGEKYYYTIRAYRTVNGVKTYSSYNTIKSATVK